MSSTPAILQAPEAPPSAAIWRLPTVLSQTGFSKTKIYDQISDGLFPKPIKLGERASGWPSDEVETVIAARIANQSEDNIRKIVQLLYDRRVERLRALLNAQDMTPSTSRGAKAAAAQPQKFTLQGVWT